jgi:hypothetical protein
MLKTAVLPPAQSVALLLLALPLHAATYHVATDGDDANPGTQDKPFGTIQHAADIVRPGDTCIIQAGTYRQAAQFTRSGAPGRPIRFVAAEGQTVVLDGTTPITGAWTRHQGDIYKTRIDADIEQLFVDQKMMVEARWPNMRFDQMFDRAAWRPTTQGSSYGRIVDPELAETGIDWTGALITLNVAHQFFTWRRTVESHGQGESALTYPKDLPVITHYAKSTRGWEDDYYYLSGKLEALDAATEWYYDRATKTLYLYPPDGKAPGECTVAYRQRQCAITGGGLSHVEFKGLTFFGCSFQFQDSSDLVLDGCQLQFPTYSRRLTDMETPSSPMPSSAVSGDRNTIRNCLVAHASGAGLTVSGDDNLVENCIIRDICWSGSLKYCALRLSGERNTARRNTLYNAGNAILHFAGKDNRVEYNHVYNGGRLCRDVSLVYTQLPRCRGSVIRYNWVHGCQTEGFRGKGRGGMGIRGDDQTRGLTVHHNVVWDCGIHGIVVKGDGNKVVNNTVFDVGPPDPSQRDEKNSKHLLTPTRAEPKKPWRKQFPLLEVQNANSLFVNNAVGNIVWRGTPLPANDNVSHNVAFERQPASSWLMDPAHMDFQPKKNSGLVDAGRIVPGITVDFTGKAPDVGAYETGAEPWTAGAAWKEK